MDPLIIIILIGLAGGMAIGLQGPLSSIITQKLGSFESVFIIHIGGALAALLPMIFVGSRLSEWKSVVVRPGGGLVRSHRHYCHGLSDFPASARQVR